MSTPSHSSQSDSLPFETLCQELNLDLPKIRKARTQSSEVLGTLQKALDELELPETTSLVAFGSLARREWTSGSDVDWTLLVDGPADPEHFRIANEIGELFREHEFEDPGDTRTFGSLISSHELIHHIGGIDDTNQNMTRRILLLLESCSILGNDVREKVVRAILDRYIACGPGILDPNRCSLKVPRFLLNDVVRLWRTFAVDYAAKKWQRADRGWALRNIKLRIPRKLTFSKGLLMCLDCELLSDKSPWSNLIIEDSNLLAEHLINGCTNLCEFTPLDLLARVLTAIGSGSTAKSLLNSYEEYLQIIDDKGSRRHLDENVPFEDALNDKGFTQAREISQKFGDAMEKLFFNESNDLNKLTQKYGVF